MRTSERLGRIEEIEGVVVKLHEKGWNMEEIRHTDEAGEPFRTIIAMACDPRSEGDGGFLR